MTYYDVLVLKSDGARKELLDLIKETFVKENETYERVDLETLMAKLYQLRQKRNKFSAHLFKTKKKDLNLEVKVQILLDIEKVLLEGNLSEELNEIDGLILIAINSTQKKRITKLQRKYQEERKRKERYLLYYQINITNFCNLN